MRYTKPILALPLALVGSFFAMGCNPPGPTDPNGNPICHVSLHGSVNVEYDCTAGMIDNIFAGGTILSIEPKSELSSSLFIQFIVGYTGSARTGTFLNTDPKSRGALAVTILDTHEGWIAQAANSDGPASGDYSLVVDSVKELARTDTTIGYEAHGSIDGVLDASGENSSGTVIVHIDF